MAGRAKENLPRGSLKYQFIYLKVRKCSFSYLAPVLTVFSSVCRAHLCVPSSMLDVAMLPGFLFACSCFPCFVTLKYLHLHHLHLHHLHLHHWHLHHLHLHHLHSTVEWIRTGSLPGGVGWHSTQAYHCQIIKGVEPSCRALIRPSSPDGLLSAQRWYSPSAERKVSLAPTGLFVL